jgi:exosortase/archaeosortase family protein
MIKVDRAYARLVAWIVASGLIIFLVYGYQVDVLVSGLNNLLLATLGTVLPAFPFLALLIVLTAMRWKDFHQVLLTEQGMTSMPLTRLAGLLLIATPAFIWYLAMGLGTPSVYAEMEVAAVSFVLVAFGTLMAINPSMTRVMFPYALLYVVGLVSPLVMLDLFSDPLIALSSYLTAGIVDVIGVHVVWQGAAFQLVSASGDQIGAVISPPCSAAYSISIFLALLGLMYLDMRKSVKLTTELAIVGVFLLPVLNSARIALTILSGYYGGTAAFWGIHDWLGYAVFFGFYLVVLVIYARAPSQTRLDQTRVQPNLSNT